MKITYSQLKRLWNVLCSWCWFRSIVNWWNSSQSVDDDDDATDDDDADDDDGDDADDDDKDNGNTKSNLPVVGAGIGGLPLDLIPDLGSETPNRCIFH